MRITNLILLTIAAIILAACSVKEITTGSGWVEDNGQTVLVNFIACSHAETKAEFGQLSGNNYPVYWSDGDVIDIIIAGDTHSSKAISIEDDDNSQATFTFEIDKDVWEGYAENEEIVAV